MQHNNVGFEMKNQKNLGRTNILNILSVCCNMPVLTVEKLFVLCFDLVLLGIKELCWTSVLFRLVWSKGYPRKSFVLFCITEL